MKHSRIAAVALVTFAAVGGGVALGHQASAKDEPLVIGASADVTQVLASKSTGILGGTVTCSSPTTVVVKGFASQGESRAETSEITVDCTGPEGTRVALPFDTQSSGDEFAGGYGAVTIISTATDSDGGTVTAQNDSKVRFIDATTAASAVVGISGDATGYTATAGEVGSDPDAPALVSGITVTCRTPLTAVVNVTARQGTLQNTVSDVIECTGATYVPFTFVGEFLPKGAELFGTVSALDGFIGSAFETKIDVVDGFADTAA
jgi:hypothetical protein